MAGRRGAPSDIVMVAAVGRFAASKVEEVGIPAAAATQVESLAAVEEAAERTGRGTPVRETRAVEEVQKCNVGLGTCGVDLGSVAACAA